MTRAVLGFDTSCYTTSCAAVDTLGNMLADVRQLLGVPLGGRGLRQSDALFQHVRHLPSLVKQAMEKAGRPGIAAVCASDRPVDGDDSYMPVFRAGASVAESTAAVLGVPCYFTTHQRGHLAAALKGQVGFPDDYLAVHLSGGTTQLLACGRESITPLGGTADISTGQLLDRVGVAMGMRFPAGAEMEALAMSASPSGRYPVSAAGFELHFSGAEAAALRDLKNSAIPPGEIAAELFDVIARSLIKLAHAGAGDTGLTDVLLLGGVASSSLLMERLRLHVQTKRSALHFDRGESVLSSDNAVGVALVGLQKYKSGGAGNGDSAFGP